MTFPIARRRLTDAEATALQAQRPAAWDHVHVRGGEDGFQACDGPLRVDGALEIEAGALVVLGDLQCDLLFVNDIASLIVTGQLRARAIIANGGIYIVGDVHAQTLVGLSFGNRVFGCNGHVRVDALIEDGHTFLFTGTFEGDLVAPVFHLVKLPPDARIARDFRTGMTPEQLQEAFVDSVLEDGALDVDRVCAALWEGCSPLR